MTDRRRHAALVATRAHPGRRARRSSRRRREVDPRDRVACFDNDGTLWCERPGYVQLDFFVDALRSRADDPALAAVPEFAACWRATRPRWASSASNGSPSPCWASSRAPRPRSSRHGCGSSWRAPSTRRSAGPLRATTYQPMLELVDALRRPRLHRLHRHRRRHRVRACRQPGPVRRAARGRRRLAGRTLRLRPVRRPAARCCGVRPPWTARPTRAPPRCPTSRRSSVDARSWPPATPGATGRCWSGRRRRGTQRSPCSSTTTTPSASSPTSAPPQTFAEPEPITEVAARAGWTVASMARDWEVVFGPWG